ncbi:hypothetical protein Tco_0215607 [Tanacetum coccineum]
MDSEEQRNAAEVLVSISRPRGKIQAEWDAEEERKRFEELKKTKSKTTLKKPTSLAQERNQMMSFLKDSSKTCIPMDSEKEKEMLKEEMQKTTLKRKGLLQYLKNKPSKEAYVKNRKILMSSEIN